MFGLFESKPFHDPQLGEFVRKRGRWRGSIALEGHAPVTLVLPGTRAEPNAQALASARAVPDQYTSWRPIIEAALLEHLEPYADEAVANEVMPTLSAASEVWPHVTLVHVAVTSQGGECVSELGYETAWDEEHTLGACFGSNGFIELCGSVLSP